MNSSDFQKLSAIRLEEARVLLRNKQYAGAYYLAGYSIECALKVYRCEDEGYGFSSKARYCSRLLQTRLGRPITGSRAKR